MRKKKLKFLGIFLVGLVVISILNFGNVFSEGENKKTDSHPEQMPESLYGPESTFIGINPYSKYLAPGIECYLGNDSVPGTGKTARQIAEDYKPYLYDGNLYEHLETCNTPDLFYRVLYGYDPYLHCNTYLVQYILFFEYQGWTLSEHKYDYVPLYIWFLEYGNSPYRVAYDSPGHYTKVWCTGALINAIGVNYDEILIKSSSSNNFMYFPFGSKSLCFWKMIVI